jgi:hypothetical protein
MIVHGPFDDSPGEINFPLGTDGVIFVPVTAPVTRYTV